MSKEIPFLQMFAVLNHWRELATGVAGWQIVSAAIDKASRSADLEVKGAEGAGPNLVREAEDTICRAYGLSSVRIRSAVPEPKSQPQPPKVREEKGPEPAPVPEQEQAKPQDAFARAEAIRAAAMKNAAVRAVPVSPEEKKKVIFGKPIKKQAIPMSDLELDMGMVVVEGDVFAVDHRELKKRGAWVVAFDMTDYTGSIRVNKFFPGRKASPSWMG